MTCSHNCGVAWWVLVWHWHCSPFARELAGIGLNPSHTPPPGGAVADQLLSAGHGAVHGSAAGCWSRSAVWGGFGQQVEPIRRIHVYSDWGNWA